MVAAVAGAGVLAAGMVAAVPGAAAAVTTLTAAEAVLPADAAANPDPSLPSVSCASAGNCTAVGTYQDSSGDTQGLLLTQTSGTWAAGEKAPLPAGTAASQFVSLSSVSCASAGYCTAVGIYQDSSGNYPALVVTETSGTWAAADASLPAGAAANPVADLVSVSCASAGNCTAVGYYQDSSGNYQGLLLTETSGTWAAAQAPLPAGVAASPSIYLSAVSCASAGNCTAAAEYQTSSGPYQIFQLTETSGTWAAAEAPPLALPYGQLSSVSCASAGNCAAVGSYSAPDSYTQGLVLTQTSGTWAAAWAPLPAGAAAVTENVYVNSVSCVPAGDCAAVGYYEPSGKPEGLLLTETSGTWAAATAPVPANAAASPNASLWSVSCVSAGNCTATGQYVDNSVGQYHEMVLTETSGTWAAAEAPLPANAAASPNAGLNSLSCAPAGSCAAVGTYQDSSGHTQGLLLTTTMTLTQPTATALASSVNPSATGQAVTYTATVSPVPDGGTVAFTDGTSVIAGCAAQPVNTSTGQATCQTTPATAGAHNIVATFSGSASFASSTSPVLTQVVTTTPCPSLAGCNLHGLNLTGAQLSGANLSGANLNGAILTGADLSSANLSGANLNSANLTSADLSGAQLSGANLNSANLTSADLSAATVTGANFNKVTWSNTTCPDGTNSDADGGTCTGHL